MAVIVFSPRVVPADTRDVKRTSTYDDYIWLDAAPPQPAPPRVPGPVRSGVRWLFITLFVLVVPLLIGAASVTLGYLWLQWYVHR